jgi:hypothetical protein
MPPDASFPVEAVRDLLGIARALFAARQRELATQPELDELAAIGKKLALALKLSKSSKGSLGAKAARKHAEEACTRLGRVISQSLPAALVVEAACVRVRRRQGPLQSERDDKREARKVRS